MEVMVDGMAGVMVGATVVCMVKMSMETFVVESKVEARVVDAVVVR